MNSTAVNMAIESLITEMQQLETSLLHTDFGGQRELLERLLAADFREINGQGETSREQVLQWLLQKDASARWELSDFRVLVLAPNIRHVTYHGKQVVPERPGSKGSLHSSLWCHQDSLDCWQLRFHQASKCV